MQRIAKCFRFVAACCQNLPHSAVSEKTVGSRLAAAKIHGPIDLQKDKHSPLSAGNRNKQKAVQKTCSPAANIIPQILKDTTIFKRKNDYFWIFMQDVRTLGTLLCHFADAPLFTDGQRMCYNRFNWQSTQTDSQESEHCRKTSFGR